MSERGKLLPWFASAIWTLGSVSTMPQTAIASTDERLAVAGFVDQMTVRQGVPFQFHITVRNPAPRVVVLRQITLLRPGGIVVLDSKLPTSPLELGPLETRAFELSLKAAKAGDFQLGIHLTWADSNRISSASVSIASIGVIPSWMPRFLIPPKDTSYLPQLVAFLVAFVSLVVTWWVNRAQQARSDRRSQVELFLPKLHDAASKYDIPIGRAAWKVSDAIAAAISAAHPGGFTRESLFLLAEYNHWERGHYEGQGGVFLSDLEGERIVSRLRDRVYGFFPGRAAAHGQFSREDLSEVTDLYQQCKAREAYFYQTVKRSPNDVIFQRYVQWINLAGGEPSGSVYCRDLLRLYAEVLLYEVNVPYGPWYKESRFRLGSKNMMALSRGERRILRELLSELYGQGVIGVRGRFRYVGRIRMRRS